MFIKAQSYAHTHATRKMRALLLAALIAVLASACHPECSWMCDDPVCPADCIPVCEAPICTPSCQNPANEAHCSKPHCWVHCPEDMCEDEMCPQCEVKCTPNSISCRNHTAVCVPLCEALSCSWSCVKPDCPKPRCELQCAQPACESTTPRASNKSKETTLVLSIVLPLLGVCLILGLAASISINYRSAEPRKVA